MDNDTAMTEEWEKYYEKTGMENMLAFDQVTYSDAKDIWVTAWSRAVAFMNDTYTMGE